MKILLTALWVALKVMEDVAELANLQRIICTFEKYQFFQGMKLFRGRGGIGIHTRLRAVALLRMRVRFPPSPL